MLCPGMVALAEEYLDADFQYGGEDQRGLFALNERFLLLMGYRKRAHMMNTMIPGLRGPKMSASVPNSNVGFLDSPEAVQKKIEDAFRAEERVQSFRNGDVMGEHTLFSVPTDSQIGPVLKQYDSYEKLEQDFLGRVLDVRALKLAVTEATNELLIPLRSSYEGNEEWQRVDKLGYPDVKL